MPARTPAIPAAAVANPSCLWSNREWEDSRDNAQPVPFPGDPRACLRHDLRHHLCSGDLCETGDPPDAYRRAVEGPFAGAEALKPPGRKHSDERLIAAFLDMVSAERGGAEN